jgi:hypothetical protein
MSTHFRIVAAAVFLIGGIAGCSHMTQGTASMPEGSRGGSQSTSPRTSSSAAPSSDPLSISCRDYLRLDEAAQTEIIAEIMKKQGSVLDGAPDVTKQLADAVCQFLPKSTVQEILVGGPVP